MERILFIDACLRGPEQSRTYGLCRHFLAEYTARHPSTEVIRRELAAMELPVMTAKLARERETWLESQPEHPFLQPARDMAGADLILVGAPYWDLSFPAALKVYLEWASMLGITFRYSQEGQLIGLSRARALVYCTTAGGPVEGQNYGCDYLKALAAMFGIPETHCVAAQGLDIWGNDVEGILKQAGAELTQLAQRL